ncbi:MAG: hypothetical protein KDA25_06125, partial [Phycisphaerales bacterium]|nr:hypothetical protein [Phycisphaerales bacterium]
SRTNALLGLGASDVRSLSIAASVGAAFNVDVPLGGETYTLVLQPFSIRAPGYEVRAQLADGSWISTDPGPVRTLRGVTAESPAIRVAGALLDDGLYATVLFPDGERYWIEPVGGRLGLGDPSMHAIYHNADVLPTGMVCGFDAAGHAEEHPAPGGAVAGGIDTLCVAELATDADVEYFNDYGSIAAVQNRIEMVVNTSNLQYESEVGIRHTLTTQLVRTSEPDPYSSFNNTDLLCQFVNEWSINQQSIQRDVAQLFTGREITGNVIGQAAELGSICNSNGCTNFPCNCGQFGTSGSYCFVQSDFNNNFSCATDLTAHELGHLWNAQHCSCPSNTMNPSITCTNTFNAALTRPVIMAYRDTLPCLDCLGPLTWTFPDGRPDLVDPAGSTTVRVEVAAGLETPVLNSGSLIYSIDGAPFASSPMTPVAPNVYDAVFPAAPCGSIVNYYFRVALESGGVAFEPGNAPDSTFAAAYGTGLSIAFEDDFETNQGWTVTNSGGLTDGPWERGIPAGGGDRGDPPTDFDGSGRCYLTDNVPGNSDVDGGSTTLTSPVMDASQGTTLIAYARWYHNSFGGAPFSDTFLVDVSDNGGASWQSLEVVGPDGPEVSGGWFAKSFPITDAGIDATNQFRIRFIAQDLGEGSVVEAGVDAVRLVSILCDKTPPCTGDFDDDGVVGPADLAALLADWGPCVGCPTDLDDDDTVGPADLAVLLAAWGPCP